MKVYNKPCKNCLLSPDAIVSPERRKQIIQDCKINQTYFVCHKASIEGEEQVCCKTFFDKLGHFSQLVRIAERLNVVRFINQPDSERLPSYSELQSRAK